MKKLLFLIGLINYFSLLNNMELVPTVELEFCSDPNVHVQSKIAKNMFRLALYDDGCTRNCPKRYPACYPNTPECKKLRLRCFDNRALEGYTLQNVSPILVKKYIDEFLDIIHQYQDWHEDPDFPLLKCDLRKILLREFSLAKVYSIPFKARKIILDVPAFTRIALEGFSSEEYACLNGVQALKGTELRVVPEDSNLVWWYHYIQKPAFACTLGGFFGMFAVGVGDKLWIPLSICATGGGFTLMNKLLLKAIRAFSSKSKYWKLQKVTL
jgi:hypothetical protein